MKRALLAAALILAASCEELGNPSVGGRQTAALVRSSESAIGRLETEVRLVPPSNLRSLVSELGPDLDHIDATIPVGGAIVAVVIKPTDARSRPSAIRLAVDFLLPDGATEHRVFIARGDRARFVAIFGLREAPVNVQTTTH